MNQPKEPKIFLFDLETSDLDANRGHILCAAGKWLGERGIYTWNIYDNNNYGEDPKHVTMRDDSRIAKEIKKLLEEATAVVAYYGGYGKFDVPYLNTRLLNHGLDPVPPLTVVDPFVTAKSQLKLSSNSMARVAEVLGCERAKYHLPMEDWMQANYHNKAAMRRLLTYCKNDVLVLEEVYLKLRPIIKNHPYIFEADDKGDPRYRCPACGSYSGQSRGSRNTASYKVFRRACTECRKHFETHRTKLKQNVVAPKVRGAVG